MFTCCKSTRYSINKDSETHNDKKKESVISAQPPKTKRELQIPAVIITPEEDINIENVHKDVDVVSVHSVSSTSSLEIPKNELPGKAVFNMKQSDDLKGLDSNGKLSKDNEIRLSQSGENAKENENKPEVLLIEDDEVNDIEEISKITRRGGVRSQTIEFQQNIVKHIKTEEEESSIRSALKANEFLRHVLKEDQMQAIIDAMQPRDVEPKETIIRQGEDGDRMFVSGSGKYQIIIDGKVFNQFHDNRIFGELAILYNTPRLATIKAITKGKTWILNRNTYKQIVRTSAIAEDEERLEFLRNVPQVNKASDEKLQKISNLLSKEFYKTNTTIIKQGDKGDKFYIVKSGTATVNIDNQGKVNTLTRGQYFGELALLQDYNRQATVKASAPGVECLILSQRDFNKYLGDLPSFVEKEDVPVNSDTIVNKYNHIAFEDLVPVKVIGAGGFGRVSLVQYKEDPDLVFALKYMKKHVIKKHGKKQAYNEKNIQINCKSMFIVGLYKTFQDRKYVYYLMESCLGGDLWGLLVRQKRHCFEENDVKFIAACILEALSYLHHRNFAYLDLKPENVLIAADGYIKLADFGNATSLAGNEKTFTFAGTPEYVAPEIIYERGHDKAADYWAFGIFIFELLVGRTPFRTNDPSYMKTYTLILKGIEGIIFPSRVHRQAEDLIKKLCRQNKTKRLGCRRNGIEDIRDHKWFHDFNWKKLRLGELKSPFVPQLDSNIDTKYFEKVEKDLEKPPDCEMWEDF